MGGVPPFFFQISFPKNFLFWGKGVGGRWDLWVAGGSSFCFFRSSYMYYLWKKTAFTHTYCIRLFELMEIREQKRKTAFAKRTTSGYLNWMADTWTSRCIDSSGYMMHKCILAWRWYTSPPHPRCSRSREMPRREWHPTELLRALGRMRSERRLTCGCLRALLCERREWTCCGRPCCRVKCDGRNDFESSCTKKKKLVLENEITIRIIFGY